MSVYTGIAQGVQPLISTFYGVGNGRQVKEVLKYALTTMLSISVIVYLVIFVFADPITTVFNSEHDLRLQQISVTGLKLYFMSVPFVGYNIILATFFTSIERVLPAHILSLLRGLVLIIPMAFLLSALWEMTGVWLTYPITEFLVAIFGFIIYRKKIPLVIEGGIVSSQFFTTSMRRSTSSYSPEGIRLYSERSALCCTGRS